MRTRFRKPLLYPLSYGGVARQGYRCPGIRSFGAAALRTAILSWMTHDTVRHPIQAAEHEAEHLREIVEEGESGATLAILIGTWLVVVVVLVAVVVTLAFLVAYLVTH
jgi:hypothetical protein